MNPSTNSNSDRIAGSLSAPALKPLPKPGEKLVVFSNEYAGLGHQTIEGSTLVSQGQQFVEVEVIGVRTAKISFE